MIRVTCSELRDGMRAESHFTAASPDLEKWLKTVSKTGREVVQAEIVPEPKPPAEQLPLIESVAVGPPEVRFTPPARTVYLVWAFRPERTGGGYWGLHCPTRFQEFATESAAREWAEKLSDQWTHIQIVRVELDGAK